MFIEPTKTIKEQRQSLVLCFRTAPYSASGNSTLRIWFSGPKSFWSAQVWMWTRLVGQSTQFASQLESNSALAVMLYHKNHQELMFFWCCGSAVPVPFAIFSKYSTFLGRLYINPGTTGAAKDWSCKDTIFLPT